MPGKRIILLHGWAARAEKLHQLRHQLQLLGWKVATLKLPGFDLALPNYIWDVNDYADYVLKKAVKLFGKNDFFVFGHSFGGRIAIKLALKNSKQLNGLILCAAGGVSRGYKFVRLFFYFLAKVGKIFLIIPPLALFWRKVLYKFAGEHDYEKTKGIMSEVFKKVVSEDLRPQVSLIKIPTLILWGKLDRITPVRDAYFIKKVVNNSKLQVFEDHGHRLPYEKPEEVAKEIEKWAKSLN